MIKEITYLIQIGKCLQFVFTKQNITPIINSKIFIDKTFFKDNEIFKEFIYNGGVEGVYKVFVYKEFEKGVQRNRAVLI